MLPNDEQANFDIFKDCLSTSIIEKLAPKSDKTGRRKATKGRKNQIKPVSRDKAHDADDGNDAAELAEFIEYTAEEIFSALPPGLRTLSYAAAQNDPTLAERYSPPLSSTTVEAITSLLPPTVTDSLLTYSLLPTADFLPTFLSTPLTLYTTSALSPPPSDPSTPRATSCEICSRSHLPLTYHHLIPRSVHAKAVKRGWHAEWELQQVAWLCRACHSYVHGIASNEELAREWWSVERLMEREDVRRWAGWVGRVRWKAR